MARQHRVLLRQALREYDIEYIIADSLYRAASYEALSHTGLYERVTPTFELDEVSRNRMARLIRDRNQ